MKLIWNKKSESGNLLLNIFRIIPVIIIMMFVLNLFFGKIPEVLDNYDQIDYYYMGRRVLTTDLTTSSFGVIDYNQLNEENINDLFLNSDFDVCYNISYFSMNQIESEYVCSSEIDSSYYETYREINNDQSNYHNKYHSFIYFGNIKISKMIKPTRVEVIFYG